MLCPVEPDARAAREEIFGPVACVIPFADEEEAVRLANDTIYGLSGSIWTRDGARALRVARAIETGVLSINSNTSVRVGDPVRRLQAVGLRARARARTRSTPTPRSSRSSTRRSTDGRPARGQGVRDHRRRRRDRRRDGARCSSARGATSSASICASTRSASWRCRPTSPTSDRSRDLYARARDAARPDRRAVQQRRHLPDRRRLGARDTLEAWERVQAANLRSVFLCCKHGIPHLLEAGGGSVINTASFVAMMGAATSQISYTASKGGVLALSRELGVEFARRGVRVNALCPGPVDTPLLRELYAKDPEQAARRLVHVPMGRFAPRRGDRQRGAVPGQRRVELRHRLDVPRRRRDLRRLHDAGLRR